MLKKRSLRKGAFEAAIIETLYATGIRVSELCNLKVCDIQHDGHFIFVTGKGNKSRLIPICTSAVDSIKRYWDYCKDWSDFRNQGHVFITNKGKVVNRNGVYGIVKRLAKAVGIKKSIHPHTFRHSYATHMYENGADLRIVQVLLGHERIDSTSIYTHVSVKHLHKAFKEFHPRYHFEK